MIESTIRRRSRLSTAVLSSGIALLLLAAGCSQSVTGAGDPSISVDDERSSTGSLEALKVEGKGFTPNGTVLVTFLMAATGGNASPYVEEQVSADAEGMIRFERRPVTCPQPANYERGSWISVIARDSSSGISGAAYLDPGREPDCRG